MNIQDLINHLNTFEDKTLEVVTRTNVVNIVSVDKVNVKTLTFDNRELTQATLECLQYFKSLEPPYSDFEIEKYRELNDRRNNLPNTVQKTMLVIEGFYLRGRDSNIKSFTI